MPMTSTQAGAAGEELFAACVTITSDGELELYKPLSDDDHTDVSAGRRGAVAALAIQVKAAYGLNRKGDLVARMYYADDEPRQDPRFVYAILFIQDAAIAAAWIATSTDFNATAYRGAGRNGKGLELEFFASPTRTDRWSPFRCTRSELGGRLLTLIDNLPPGPPPRIAGAHRLLRRDQRGGGSEIKRPAAASTADSAASSNRRARPARKDR